MKKYLIKKMNCSPEEADHLLEIGIEEGAEIEIVEQNHKQICMFLVDNTKFCIRKSVFDKLEVEEVK